LPISPKPDLSPLPSPCPCLSPLPLSQYHRLAGRRGKKRALVAVAHTLLVIIYHIIKYRVDYQDLGPDYFLRLEPERQKRYLVKRLEQLGYEVQLAEIHAA